MILQSLDRVLAFLPFFEDKDSKFYKVQSDLSVFDRYTYANKVCKFLNVVDSEGFTGFLDWRDWQDEAAKFVEQPNLLESAELTTLHKLLTVHLAKERHCQGHIAAMIDNGQIVAILKRLKQIRLEMASSDQITRNLLERISVIQGDITKQQVDAIVNAANNTLLGGAGVDGAIHRAAGKILWEECRALRGCSTGEAKITEGYNLPAKRVIHTVGPIWRGGRKGEDKLLRSCYRNSLNLTQQNSLRTIAFPAISTGTYGFPLERATQIAVEEVKQFLIKNFFFERVIFVCFSDETYRCYLKTISEIVA